MKRKGFVALLTTMLAATLFFSEAGTLLPAKAEEVKNNGVRYISEESYNSLDDDTKEVYDRLCDELDELSQNGLELENVVFATDSNGVLYESYVIPYNVVSQTGSEYFSELLTSDVSANDPSVSENDITLEEETTSEEDPTEDTVKETPSSEKHYISENMEFIGIVEDNDEAFEETDEETLGEEENNNSLFTYIGSDYFTKNLSEYETLIYKAAKKKYQSGALTFSFDVPYGIGKTYTATGVAKAVSVYATTYLSSFNKVKFNSGITVTYTYSNGTTKCSARLIKAKYFDSKLEDKARTKMKQIVNNAYTYASTHYPGESFTYGIVEYIDEWLCEHASENPTGLSEDPDVKASKEYFFCHSIYGPLLYGYGVCDGYAKAMSQMLDLAGITNIYVVSDTHAYVYVLMNDDKWYIVDSMLNDAGDSSSKQYLLSGAVNDETHNSTGNIFKTNYDVQYTIDYPEVSQTSFVAKAEEFYLNKEVLSVSKGTKAYLKVTNDYYKDYKKSWSSDNPYVASVSSSGRVTANNTGEATITCNIAGRTTSCKVYVYQVSKLNFANGKNTYSKTYVNQGAYTLDEYKNPTFTGTDSISVTIQQKGKILSGYLLYLYDRELNNPKVTSSDKSVATIGDISFSGDQINVTLIPKKIGKTTIKIKFGGKTATLTYTVKQQLRDEWFTEPSQTEYTYNGTEKKPTVSKTGDIIPLPKNIKTKTTYLNNTKAGTATISISGKDYYSGTVTRTFKITPIILTEGNTSLSITSQMDYTGKTLKPKITLYYKKHKMVLGSEYTVAYAYSSTHPDAPLESGTYTVTVSGTGNYAGVLSTKTLVVNKLDASKLTLSVSNIAWDNNNILYPNIKVSSETTVIPKETSVVSRKNYDVYYYKKMNNGQYSNDRLTSISARGTYKVVVVFTANNIDTTKIRSREAVITVY